MTTHPLHHLGFEALLSRPVDAASGRTMVQPTPLKNGVRIVKGARVRLADGTAAKVAYVDPNMRIARVRTEDGRNVTVRHKDLRSRAGD